MNVPLWHGWSCFWYLQEYEQGDVETKRQILSNLDKYGVKNCSWVHQLSKSTKTHNAHTEDVIRNFYTRPLRCMFFCCHVAALHVACTLSGSRRSAIFKIEGVDESSLANDDMKQLLEEILAMCELRFGHARQTQLHDKFDVLSTAFTRMTLFGPRRLRSWPTHASVWIPSWRI